MAKGSGGTRASVPGGGSSSAASARMAYSAPSAGEYVPVTDRGMNDKQRAYITAFESLRRNSGVERGLTVDKDGNIVKERRGGTSSIRWEYGELPKDGILTHIHPIEKDYANWGQFYRSIGSTFSGQDIATAIRCDLAEIRAVTPGYTFSMRRPASGWGADPKAFLKDYNKVRSRHIAEARAYASGTADRKTWEQRWGRAFVTIEDRTMRELANKYGFTYTRSRKTK